MQDDQKTEEKAPGQNEDRYKELFDNMSEGVAIYEAVDDGEDFVFVDYNKAGQSMDGVALKDALGKKVSGVFPGVKEFGLLKVFERVWKTGEPERHPVSLYKDDKLSFYRANYVYKLRGGQIVAVYSDETKRMQAKQSLRESEEKYRLLAENATDVIWTMDMDLRFVFVSPSILQLRGYTAEEAKAQSLSEVLVPESLSTAMALFARQMKLAESGDVAAWDPIVFEAEQLCKDGSTTFTSNNAKIIRGPDGQPRLIVGVTHDITERKQAELALQVERDRLISVFAAMEDGVYIVDQDYNIEFVNAVLTKVFGSYKGRKCYAYFHDREEVCP